ncbi:hypothetical protein DXV75_00415 [Alteromonas aestuariivivens]|uniref:Uncharacterized protein n=1 Tax=Alteromonas aestuariivivens TaxID=1938339 RepID=A0A3D8MFJ5_9ALTE|nr:DUF6776 family protein [Alteromonas aestuariivivens]RDV28968.1 hypothetical protein DXV75_00415 [Alteromonas aestuariivivens]
MVSLSDLKRQFNPLRLTVLITAAMLAMVYLGYRLAGYHWHNNAKVLDNAMQTSAMLVEENAGLRDKLARLEVDAELSKRALLSLQDEMIKLNQQSREQQQKLGFYQRVVAPETTQDGFAVDGLQVNPSGGGLYRLSFVLLQQRQNKAVVKGKLAIKILGVLGDKPAELNPGQPDFMPEGDLVYRFKYFQAVEIPFQLPEGFTPEYIEFSTEVYQYTTKRGDYQRRVAWLQVYDEPDAGSRETGANELIDAGSY